MTVHRPASFCAGARLACAGVRRRHRLALREDDALLTRASGPRSGGPRPCFLPLPRMSKSMRTTWILASIAALTVSLRGLRGQRIDQLRHRRHHRDGRPRHHREHHLLHRRGRRGEQRWNGRHPQLRRRAHGRRVRHLRQGWLLQGARCVQGDQRLRRVLRRRQALHGGRPAARGRAPRVPPVELREGVHARSPGRRRDLRGGPGPPARHLRDPEHQGHVQPRHQRPLQHRSGRGLRPRGRRRLQVLPPSTIARSARPAAPRAPIARVA